MQGLTIYNLFAIIFNLYLSNYYKNRIDNLSYYMLHIHILILSYDIERDSYSLYLYEVLICVIYFIVSE